jgi:ABC-2 type transport system permease protein
VALVVDPAAQDSAAVRTRVSAAVAGQSAVVQAAAFAAPSAGGFDAGVAAARQVAGGSVALDVQTSTAGQPGFSAMKASDYATVGELVLFLFLIGLTSAGDLVEARNNGTARRMLATPTPAWAVIAGEAAGRYAVLTLQALFIIVLGAGFFGVSWGNPLGVGLVVAAYALVGTSVSLLVGTVARSNEQATSLGPPIGIALAMLGGAMWPLEIVGPVMRTVGHFTPHAWALDAFVDLMGNRVGPGAVLGQVGVLLAFSAALLPLAVLRLRADS